jgi:capsular polysaccharide biosynthesis protein
MGETKLISKAYTINRHFPVNYKKGELDFCRAEFSYVTNDIVLSTFKNVLISKSGCIYTDFYKIVRDSLLTPSRIKFAYLHLAKSLLFKKKITLNDNEQYLVAFDGFTSGQYHWFCDFLPRIIALGEQTKDFVLILPLTQYNKTMAIEILDLLKIKFKDILYIKEDEYFICKQCFMVSHPCITGRTDDVQMRKVKTLIDTHIVSKIKDEPANGLLYISRVNSKYRHLLNEAELMPMLKDHGFTIVRFEEHSFMEQVQLAANSKVMMGLHGAGLTNMIFMKPDSLVSEFRRAGIYHNQCYWHLADSVHLQYAYLFGTPDSNKVIEGNGSNLTVSVQQLSEHLNWLDKNNFL